MKNFTIILVLCSLIWIVIFIINDTGKFLSPQENSIDLQRGSQELTSINSSELKIYIVYDNNNYNASFSSDWGFSCLIKTSNITILFDTGGNGDILVQNLKKFNINPKDIDIIFLSHIHGDHTGGLKSILDKNSNVTVVIPKSFPVTFKLLIKSYNTRILEVSEFSKVCKGFYSTGEMGNWITEQSLVINTDKGLIVITGCAHPGIVKIIEKARNSVNKDILLVLGGFHLIGKSKSEIKQIINDFKKLNVKYVAPCHCTGDLAINMFKMEYGSKFIKTGVGRIIEIKNLG